MVIETKSAHLTPEGGNVFLDLGFSSDEAAQLKAESDRRIGIAKLVAQVQAMVAQGTADSFDAQAWVLAWLDTPLPALGGQKPSSIMGTSEGQAIVSKLISRMTDGGYA